MMQPHENPSPGDVVSAYLTAFYDGDFDAAERFLSEDFEFSGPFVSLNGRGAFLESAQGLKAMSRGHRLLKQWHHDHDVCSVYELSLQGPQKSGKVTMAEWHTLRNGKIRSALVMFDSASFRAIAFSDEH